jgi:hypothetical protein
MSCQCSPQSSNVKSCCQGSSSACCNANTNCCCTALGGISNVDQGFFQNLPTKKVSNIPTIDLAYFTNCDNNNEVDNTINLNPTYLTWTDFNTLLFRNNSSTFYIDNSNASNAAISFYGQTYETTQTKKAAFSLTQQIIKAWSKKNNKPENTVPIQYKIQLERQSFLTKSLASINCYQISLHLDEAISTLLSQSEIEPADLDSSAIVKFTINYRNYFCPLDTSILVNFTFITSIPGYKNCVDNGCGNYSNDTTKPRKVFHYDDDNMSCTSENSSVHHSNSSTTSSSNGSSGSKNRSSYLGDENKTYFTTFDMDNSAENDTVTVGEDIEKILYSNKSENNTSSNEDWR